MTYDDGITLGAGICFYNDKASLQRCLESIVDGCDIIFCIDGKFPTFEAPEGWQDLSTDGSRGVVLQYENTRLIDKPAPEPEKRNTYLDLCKMFKVDYCLMIDSDEWVDEVNWPEFRANCKRICNDERHIYNIPMIYTKPPTRDHGHYPRLWYKPYRLEYYQCHNIFRVKASGEHRRINAEVIIPGIMLNQNDDLRDKDFIRRIYEYQERLIQYEKPLRKIYG